MRAVRCVDFLMVGSEVFGVRLDGQKVVGVCRVTMHACRYSAVR